MRVSIVLFSLVLIVAAYRVLPYLVLERPTSRLSFVRSRRVLLGFYRVLLFFWGGSYLRVLCRVGRSCHSTIDHVRTRRVAVDRDNVVDDDDDDDDVDDEVFGMRPPPPSSWPSTFSVPRPFFFCPSLVFRWPQSLAELGWHRLVKKKS